MYLTGKIGLVTDDVAVAEGIRSACAMENLQLALIDTVDEAVGLMTTEHLAMFIIDLRRASRNLLKMCVTLKIKAQRPISVVALIDLQSSFTEALSDARIDDVLVWPFTRFSFSARIRAQFHRIDTAEKLAYKIRDSWTLIEITSKLVGKGDLLDNLFDMISILSKELDVDRGSVVLVRPEGDYGLVIASSDNRDIQNLAINLSGYPEIKRVLHNREPLIVSDVDSSALFETVRSRMRTAHVASIALFPIVEDEQVLGVIFLRYLSRQNIFDQRALVFCQTVANATAIALRNHEILVSLREKDQQIQQVQSEAELRLAALKPYEDFFFRSLDGMVVLSDTGVILYINPEGAALLRSADLEIRGVPFSSFLPLPQRERFEALVEESERGNKLSMDLTIAARDGLERIISTSCAPIGTGGMILLTMRDVTDERRMARRLIDAQERLIETEKQTAIMEIAGAAAHEMNQPLTSVMASVSMFRRILVDAPGGAIRLLDTMDQEIERMASIIRRLSKLTEYSTKEYVGDAKIIDLEKSSTANDSGSTESSK